MEELVHRYLTKEYYICSFPTDDIFSKETDSVKGNLAFELMRVFSIENEQAIEFVEKWAKKIKPDVDLFLFWVLHTEKNLTYTGRGKPFISPGIYTRETDRNLVQA